MKKRLLPVALLLGTFATNAQVGIGTATPNKSAELLIESSNRGLLIPNVALTSATDRTTITNGNVQSLMVYATKISEKKDITPGYYYWDINKWVRLTADKDIPQIVVNNFQDIVNMDGDKVQTIIKNIVKNTEGNVIYEGDKFYTFTKDGDKVVKQEIKDKLTSIVYDEVTGDYIYYNENAVDRNGKIIGEGIRIKVKETVINKFGDIINNKTVQDYITNYLDGTYVGGNVYYEGDKLTYVTKEGERKEVSINQVITANESKTAIITVNKKQYYVSEEYLVANKGVVPTTVDVANLPKGIYAIDVVGGVVNNLEEIVNKGPVTVDGRTFKTVNDYITYLTESKGGFTKIVYDQSTGDVIFQEWDETTQKYVNVDNSKFSTIVKGNETLTTLLDKGDGTLEYTDEKGKTVSFDSNKTTVETQNGVYTFKDGKGEVITTIDTNAKAIGYDNTDSGLSSKDVQSAIDEIVKSLGSGADVSIKDNNNGSFSVVSKDGTVLGTVNKAGLIDNTNGTYTFTNGNGKDVTIDVPQSVINQFDKIINGGPITVNGNTYTTVEEYLKDFVEKNETVTTLKNNNNGTYTYTSENGTETIIDIPSSVVKQFETIVKQPVTVDGRAFTNVDEYIKYVTETKGGFTKIVYNKEGDVVFQEWNETTQKFENVDNSKFSTIVKGNETVTTLVKNVDGTYTYYNEKQIGADGLPLTGETGVTIDPKEVSVALNTTKNVYEFKNSKGDVIGEIDANAGGIVYNDNSTQLGATNVQGAIEKLLEKITTVEGTRGDLVVSGGLEFIAKTTGVKALLADANIQVANKGISTDKLDDKAVTNEKLGEKSVSADKMTSFTSENGTTNPVAEGQIPVADGKGGVSYKEISGETLKGKALTSGSISVIGGEKALLDATKIEVTGGKNKGDVLVTTNVTLKGADGKDVIGADGNPVYITEWVNPKDFVSGTVTAKNGVTVVNDTEGNSEFKLGGALTEATVIDTKENTLAIANMDLVEKGKVLENNLVIADTNGVLKQTSAKNLIEDAVEVGDLKAKALTTDGVIVIGTDSTSTTVLADNSLLADVKLNIGKDKITADHIATGAVTSDEILDGTIKPKDMESAGESKVLVTGADGQVQWIDQSTLNNKDTFTGNAPISIVEGSTNTTGGKDYVIQIADANGTTAGVTKQAEVDPTILFKDGVASVNVENIAKTQGKALTSGSISVIGGEKALLDATKIEVTGGKNKGDVLVTTDVTLKGADGKDVIGADNKPVYITEWVNPKDFVSGTVTAKNGITVVNDKDGNSEFKLGGALTEATVIDTKENTLAIANMDSVEKGKVLENNLVIADANGVLKQTSAKNLIEDVITDGKLEAKDLTSQSIIVKGGDNSLLKDTNLEIKGGTSEGQVLVSTPELDANGQPVVDENGKGVYITKWVNADKVGVEVTNGIQKITGDDGTTKLGLGGTLTEATKIKTDVTNTLAIEGLASVDKPVTDNNIVITDKEGVLKQTSAKNLIEDAVEAGNLEAKTLKGAGITVTAGVEEGTDTSVASSLLKDVTLGIADGAVTSDKMKATVTDGNGGSTNAEAGMVPVANANGTVTYNKVDAKDVTYTKPTTDNGLTSNTVEGAINELAGKKGDLKVAGGMLTINDGGKDALRHDATISLNLEGMNAIVETKVDYTAKVEDVIVLAIAESKDLVVTLPDAVANKGKKYTIKKHDAKEDFYVTVKGNIVGATELYTALPYSGWDLVSDGTQWQIVNKF
ncbi:hypothetical protein NJB85_11005 [Myroides odoratimimus]|uniref:hypothetical protein n=1 Tax=Myroides odoratimimus TaxID=76832 RepID=UPI002097D383|nr:hypothetical protein [Myroides odoratimimus]MCO7723707.1 hypothetical protein [Myroides odoratimimus]